MPQAIGGTKSGSPAIGSIWNSSGMFNIDTASVCDRAETVENRRFGSNWAGAESFQRSKAAVSLPNKRVGGVNMLFLGSRREVKLVKFQHLSVPLEPFDRMVILGNRV